MSYLRAVKLTASLLLLPLSAFASNNPVVGDTYLNSAAATTAFGAQQSILVGSTNTGLLQVAAIVPAGTTAAQVSQATLTLYVNGLTTAGTIDVRRVTKAWAEAGASYSKNITFDSTSYGTITASAAGKYVTVDVTALVQYWIANPGSNLGIALVSNGAEVSFDSKENTSTAHVAALNVTLANSGPQGPAGPAGATGPQGIPGLQGIPGPQGIPGAQGAIGATGAAGAVGPQGPVGAAGAVGAIGATGAAGPVGPQGPTGATGATGAAGANGAGYYATSISPVTPGLGSKTFTTQAGLAYVAGARVRAFFTGAPTTYVEGTVTSYSGTTLVLDADDFNGSTTPTSWTFTIAGKAGAQGPQGVQGPMGATGATGATGAIGPQGPSGPTGATGPAGSSGAAILKDADGVTLGTVLSASSTGVISFRTSTGYIVSANIDGTIPNSQFYWTSSDCSGSDPALLNGGGVGVKRYDKFVAYSQKTNQLYMITNTNSNHIALTQPLVYGALENTSSTNPALYTCSANTNNATANGFTIQRITPTALGIPTAAGTPLTLPAPLSF